MSLKVLDEYESKNSKTSSESSSRRFLNPSLTSFASELSSFLSTRPASTQLFFFSDCDFLQLELEFLACFDIFLLFGPFDLHCKFDFEHFSFQPLTKISSKVLSLFSFIQTTAFFSLVFSFWRKSLPLFSFCPDSVSVLVSVVGLFSEEEDELSEPVLGFVSSLGESSFSMSLKVLDEYESKNSKTSSESSSRRFLNPSLTSFASELSSFLSTRPASTQLFFFSDCDFLQLELEFLACFDIFLLFGPFDLHCKFDFEHFSFQPLTKISSKVLSLFSFIQTTAFFSLVFSFLRKSFPFLSFCPDSVSVLVSVVGLFSEEDDELSEPVLGFLSSLGGLPLELQVVCTVVLVG